MKNTTCEMTIYTHMYGRFRFYLDRIEADLPTNVGHVGLRNIIFWERSYWFSTLRNFFVGFHFLLELKKTG